MNFGLKVKYCIADFFEYTGLLRYLLGRLPGDSFFILMYHRVLDEVPAECQIQSGMYVSPKTLDKHIAYLKQCFSITALSTLSSLPLDRHKNSKPLCALSFDDGWHDFYTNAFPVLKKHGVPATVFLPTSYIGTKSWFWADQLASLYIKGDLEISFKNDLKGAGRLTHLINAEKNAENFEQIVRYLKTAGEETVKRLIGRSLDKNGSLGSDFNKPAFLSWAQVREMQRSGLVSFGSHTAGHRILTLLSRDEASRELIESRDVLLSREVVEPGFIPFCYPNGNYDDALAELVANHGYQLAVTTERGRNTGRENKYKLKRLGMHEDMSASSSMLGCRLLQFF